MDIKKMNSLLAAIEDHKRDIGWHRDQLRDISDQLGDLLDNIDDGIEELELGKRAIQDGVDKLSELL